MLFLRFSIAAGLMAFLLMARRESLPRGRVLGAIDRHGGLRLCWDNHSLTCTAIKYASAGLVALLLYLYPMFVFILSVIVFREKVTCVKVIAIIVALIGTALTVDPKGGQLIGALLAIAAALIYSVYIIVGTNVMKHVSAVQSSTVILHPQVWYMESLTARQWRAFSHRELRLVTMSGIVLVATVIPVVTFLAGLERVGPTNAAMLSTLEPVVTVLLAAWLFKERLKVCRLLGGG